MKKVVTVGILYLLWQFTFGGPEVVQADGRRYAQQHRSSPRFSVIIPVIIPVPLHRVYTPRVPSYSYPRNYGSYGREFQADGIYVSGSSEGKGAAEEILLDMGKTVLTQSYGNAGAEMRITERSFKNTVILIVELRDLSTRELLDRREGRADFDSQDGGLSKHDAYVVAARAAIGSLRNL